MDEKKRFSLEINENDILENKVRVLEVKPLSGLKRVYRVVPKNICKVNKEIEPKTQIIEEGEIEKVEEEFIDV